MDDQERDYGLGQSAEKLVGQIETDLQYDEEGRSYFEKSTILNLVFRVADFMRKLSKKI